MRQKLVGAEPLEFTLGPEREALIQCIKNHTRPDGRILWEEMPRSSTAAHWTPLLPILTQRSFIGGLDSEATIEHATIGLSNQVLQGEAIENWQDPNLEAYCKRVQRRLGDLLLAGGNAAAECLADGGADSERDGRG